MYVFPSIQRESLLPVLGICEWVDFCGYLLLGSVHSPQSMIHHKQTASNHLKIFRMKVPSAVLVSRNSLEQAERKKGGNYRPTSWCGAWSGTLTFGFMIMCSLYCCQQDVALGSLAIRSLLSFCEWKSVKLGREEKDRNRYSERGGRTFRQWKRE